MKQTTKRAMGARLPSLPVHEETRKQVENIAKSEGKSIGQIQREALLFFLQSRDPERITTDTPCHNLG